MIPLKKRLQQFKIQRTPQQCLRLLNFGWIDTKDNPKSEIPVLELKLNVGSCLSFLFQSCFRRNIWDDVDSAIIFSSGLGVVT